MTVHMIRLWSEPPRNDNHFQKMRQACEDWAASYDETLTTQRLSLMHAEPVEETDVEHTSGWWRFSWSEDLQTLLSDLEADLQSEVRWYKIKYHSCDHDQSENRTGCEWDESETREYGTVPL